MADKILDELNKTYDNIIKFRTFKDYYPDEEYKDTLESTNYKCPYCECETPEFDIEPYECDGEYWPIVSKISHKSHPDCDGWIDMYWWSVYKCPKCKKLYKINERN